MSLVRKSNNEQEGKQPDQDGLDYPLQLSSHPRGSQSSGCAASTLHMIFRAMVHTTIACGLNADELETKLHSMGLRVGYRVLDLVAFREKGSKIEGGKLMSFLDFVCKVVWKYLFGGTADLYDMQKPNEWLIKDFNWSLSQFIDPPAMLRGFCVGAYAAGIVEGTLTAADYPCKVTAHTTAESNSDEREMNHGVTLHIEVLPEILNRDARMKELGWKYAV